MQAIVELATWLGNVSIAAEFETHREFARASTLKLWNPEIESFATVPAEVPPQLPPPTKHGPKPWPDIDFVQNEAACNLTEVRALNKPVGVRELFDFTPWYYSAVASPLIPAEQASHYLGMWSQLFDVEGFAGKWGLTTAERRHRCYNYVSDTRIESVRLTSRSCNSTHRAGRPGHVHF